MEQHDDDPTEQAFHDGWESGYVVAHAELLSGEARLLEWDGKPLRSAKVCEGCNGEIHPSEYGITLDDDLWASVAPRPGADYMESGLLCLDCIEKQIDRSVMPADVKTTVRYGDRPTTRAAILTLAVPIAFGQQYGEDEEPSEAL